MAGHFYFGHNRNMQRLRVGDYFTNIVLCVKSPVAPTRAISGRRCGIQTKTHGTAPSPLAGQLGILFDFKAPAVVIHQMPVENVQLVHRHGIQQLFYLVLVEKVAADIEHQPAPLETRLVGDVHTR